MKKRTVKLTALSMSVLMAASLTACGGGGDKGKAAVTQKAAIRKSCTGTLVQKARTRT